MSRPGRTITCSDCSTVTDQHSRGLCESCYKLRRHRGDLMDAPRVTRSYADTIEDLEFLCDQGVNEVEAARRLGIKRDSVWSVCRRTDRLDLWKALTS